jgi:hypothetical protein
MMRPTAVAGSFYPADAGELTRALERCFAACAGPADGPAPRALICPHAGYIYSGASAAAACASVPEDSRIETVVIIGPNHTGLGPPVSISDSDEWATPFGAVPVDRALGESLAAAFPAASFDSLAHAREHSIEVQLPLLQFRLGRPFGILPIVLGLPASSSGHEVCAGLGRALAEVAAPDRTLLLASTDMSHYLSASDARRRDRAAIDAVLALDSADLVRAVRQNGISMCGVMPSAAVIAAAVTLGASGAELADYRTSGDVTGDDREVVSYAAFVIR